MLTRVNRAAILLPFAILLLAGAALADPPQVFSSPWMLQPAATLGPVVTGQGDYCVAAGDNQFLGVWNDGRHWSDEHDFGGMGVHFTLHFGRIGSDATLLDPVGVWMDEGFGVVSAAWNGQNYLAVGGTPVRRYRISPDGQMLGGFGGTFTANGANASVATDGSDWFVVWDQQQTPTRRRIYGAKALPSGEISASIMLCSIDADQFCPHAAWTGSCYLVTFEDCRNGGKDIYALRVQADGLTVLDPNGFAVCTASGDQTLPKSALLESGQCLVAWEDPRNPANGKDVFAARVTDAGVVQDPGGFALCSAAGIQEAPRVAGFAGSWVVVWEDRGVTPYAACMARVSPDRTILDPGGRPIYPSVDYQVKPNVTVLGATVLTTWGRGTDAYTHEICGVRYDNHWSQIDPQPFRLTQSGQYQRNVGMTTTQTGFLSAFEESDTLLFEPDLYIAPLDSDGAMTGVGQTLLAGGPSHDLMPDVAYDGTNCLVTWVHSPGSGQIEQDNVWAARVTPQGAILDSPPKVVCGAEGAQEDARVAYGGGVYLVVWQDCRSGSNEVYAARVDPSGTVLDPDGFLVGHVASEHVALWPSVVWGGDRFLIAWYDAWPNHDSAIKGRFIDPTDPASSPPTFLVDYRVLPDWVTYPAVASSGSQYVVAYAYGLCPLGEACDTKIYAKRYSSDGTLLDPTPIIVCNEGDNDWPEVYWNNNAYLVLWAKYQVLNNNLYASQVLSSGEVIDRNGVNLKQQVTDWGGRDKRAAPRGDGKALVAWRGYTAPSPYGIDRITEAWYTAPQIVRRISDARALPENSLITITGKPVSAGTDDLTNVFYIEEPNRCAGMRVLWTGGDVFRNVTASVSGLVKTIGGERVILAQAVGGGSLWPDPILPLFMNNTALGGASPDPIIPQIPGAVGTYNVGLLVSVCGRVTAVGANWFYIDDGSGNTGVKVTVAGVMKPPLALPEVDDYVTVTGMSSCDVPEGETEPVRLLRSRRTDDIAILAHMH